MKSKIKNMKIASVILIFSACLFGCYRANKPVKNFYLPSIGFVEIRSINDFNNKFPVEFYGYEGLVHKINNENDCFKIIPCSKSSSEAYRMESNENRDIINKLGNQEIVYFEISFCNSLTKEDFEFFLTRYYSDLTVSREYKFDTVKVFYDKELLLQGAFGMNSRIITYMTYGIPNTSESHGN